MDHKQLIKEGVLRESTGAVDSTQPVIGRPDKNKNGSEADTENCVSEKHRIKRRPDDRK